MSGVLSVEGKEVREEGKARSHVASAAYGKEFEFYPNYNGLPR